MEHSQEVALNSDVCPVCGGTGYELYMQRVDGYDTPLEFAKPCTRCRTQRRLQDMTGVPPQFRDADLGKFGFDSYSRDMGNLRKIAADFLKNYRERWEGKPEYEFIPCGIEPPQPDAEMQAIREELLIITTNSQREKTDWDRVQEAKHLHDVLQRYKKRGGRLPGRMREIIADTLNTSTTQIGRMGAIAKKLIPEFQAEMKEKRLGISAAYELSGLPEEQQRAAYAEHREKGGLSVSDAKQRKSKPKPQDETANTPAQVEWEREAAPSPNREAPRTFEEFQEQQKALRPLEQQKAAEPEPLSEPDTAASALLDTGTPEEIKRALERLENHLLPYCVSMAEADENQESEWALDVKAVLAAMAELQRRVNGV